MKKILAFALSVVLAGTALTGCGKSDSGEEPVSNVMTSEELDSTALTMFKAANSALTGLNDYDDMEFDSTFYFDSEGKIFGNYDGKYIDEFIETYRTFFNALDDYYWIIGMNTNDEHNLYDKATEIYIATSKDSDVIGAYENHFDVSGKSISDIENELADWAEKNGTFGMTVEEFENEYNKIVPDEFFNDKLTISKTETDAGEVLTSNTYEFNYKIKDEHTTLTLLSNDDGYIDSILLFSDASIGYFLTEDNSNKSIEFVEILLSPYLIMNKDSGLVEILELFNSMESTKNENMTTLEGTDGKFTYTITSGYGTFVTITLNK